MKKSVVRAYLLAIFGTFLGLVGIHRFYLHFYTTGGIMLFTFFGGIACMALGYAKLLEPMIETLAASGGVLADLPQDKNYLNPDADVVHWFTVGKLLCLGSLCWLVIDLIFMFELVKKANNIHKPLPPLFPPNEQASNSTSNPTSNKPRESQELEKREPEE